MFSLMRGGHSPGALRLRLVSVMMLVSLVLSGLLLPLTVRKVSFTPNKDCLDSYKVRTINKITLKSINDKVDVVNRKPL